MATLIDTFVSIFSAETDDLRRGHDQAKRSTDEIVDSMKKADAQATKTSASIGSMMLKAVSFLATAAVAQRTISGVMTRAGEIYQMNQTAESIGVAVENMDAFTRSVTDNGGTAQGVITTLTGTYRAMGRAISETGSEQAKTFASMGVNLKDANGELRDTMDVVLDVADAMKGLEGGVAEDLAQRLGITDRRTIEVMLKGREELNSMMRAHKEYGVVTRETAERAAAFSDAMSYLTGGLDRAGLKLTNALLPAINWVLEVLGDLVRWMHDNQEFVIGFFLAIAAVVAAKFLPVMIAAGGAVLAATWPFLLAAAAIAGLAAMFALVYDDIRNFMKGNDSLIGQIAEEYPALGRIIENLGKVFKAVFEAFGVVLDWLSEKFGVSFDSIGDVIRAYFRFLFSTLNQVAEWAEGFEQHFRDAADAVVGIFKWLWEQIQELLKPITGAFNFVTDGIGNIGGSISSGAGRAADTVKGWFSGSDDEVPSDYSSATGGRTDGPEAIYGSEVPIIVRPGVDEANEVLQQASTEPMNSVTSSVIQNSARTSNETNLQIGELNVNTQATDAQGVARDVRSELADQLKALNTEHATGVAR